MCFFATLWKSDPLFLSGLHSTPGASSTFPDDAASVEWPGYQKSVYDAFTLSTNAIYLIYLFDIYPIFLYIKYMVFLFLYYILFTL